MPKARPFPTGSSHAGPSTSSKSRPSRFPGKPAPSAKPENGNGGGEPVNRHGDRRGMNNSLRTVAPHGSDVSPNPRHKPRPPDPKPPHKRGAPSKFNRKYCRDLVEHMSQGGGFWGFAGLIGVSMQTLSNWCAAYPEFMEAKEKGEAACLAWWEELAKRNAASGVGNLGGVAFIMKNRFREFYGERREIQVTGKDGGPIQTDSRALVARLDLSKLPDDKFEEAYEIGRILIESGALQED